MKRAWLAFLLPLALAGSALAAGRFPSPQFERPYVIPSPTQPAARAMALEWLDVAVLAATLGLASWLILRRRSRRWIAGLMLFSLAYFGFWRKGCVCPVGSLQNVALAIGDASYAIPLTVLAFFVLPLLFTLLFGRTFCAAVCPLGAAQDAVVLRPLRLPRWLQEGLGLLRYLYLALALLLVWTGAEFIVCRYDPFVGFFRLSAATPMVVFGVSVLLIGTIVARPYCRFACPYGVLLGWLSRLARWHAGITPDECIRCRLCEESCPFGAIRRPASSSAVPESREAGGRRLALLLLALPLIVGAGAAAGRVAGGPLSRLHPDCALAEQVWSEGSGAAAGTTVESDAFRALGGEPEPLFEEADALQRRFRLGGAWAGAFLGLVVGVKLLAFAVRRSRKDYEPSRSECLSCGRCFEYCPREKVRRGKLPATALRAPVE